MASNDDWLGGYTLSELLGATPVTKSPKQMKKDGKVAKKAAGKRGIVSTVFGAPVRLVMGVVKLPVTIVTKLVNGVVAALAELVKLPFRVIGAIAGPWRKQ